MKYEVTPIYVTTQAGTIKTNKTLNNLTSSSSECIVSKVYHSRRHIHILTSGLSKHIEFIAHAVISNSRVIVNANTLNIALFKVYCSPKPNTPLGISSSPLSSPL